MTRFAVDLDGTLAMAVEATLDDLNAEWGSHYTVDDITTWHYWNAFKELQHLPEPKRREFILRRMDKVWNEGRVRAYPEAAAFMRELRRYGRVDIVTGRSGGTTDAALENFFKSNGIPYDGIQRTTGSGKVKALYGYNTYVDDDPSLAAEIAERWPQKQVMLPDRPWNRQVPDSPNVHRIHDLGEAIPAGRPQQARLFRHADDDEKEEHVHYRFVYIPQLDRVVEVREPHGLELRTTVTRKRVRRRNVRVRRHERRVR